MLLTIANAFATDIKIIVPFAPGGIADQTARTLEKILSQNTSYRYLFEYRTGAGGQIGTKYVINKKSPETVLLLHSAAVVIHSIVYATEHQLTDLIPVATFSTMPMLLITHKDSHVNTLNKLLTTTDPVFYGSGGTGSVRHISGEILKDSTKQNLIHVPFRGEAAAFPELLSGRVSLLFASSGLIEGHDNIKVLAVAGPTRHQDYPDVPTLAEHGIKGFDVDLGWLVLLANPGADPAIIKKIQTAINLSVKDPVQIRTLSSAGVDVEKDNTLDTKRFLDSEQKRLRKFVK